MFKQYIKKGEKKNMSEAIPNWVKGAVAKIQEDEAKESKYFKFPEGVTEILVDDAQPPKEVIKDFKGEKRTRWEFSITTEEGQIKTLEVGKILYRKICRALAQGLNPMKVIRAGTDIHTSYGIEGLMKE